MRTAILLMILISSPVRGRDTLAVCDRSLSTAPTSVLDSIPSDSKFFLGTDHLTPVARRALQEDLAEVFPESKLHTSQFGILIDERGLAKQQLSELSALRSAIANNNLGSARDSLAKLTIRKNIEDIILNPELLDQFNVRNLSDQKSFTGYPNREYVAGKTATSYLSIGLGFDSHHALVNIDILSKSVLKTRDPNDRSGDRAEAYLRFDRDKLIERDCPHCVQTTQCTQCHGSQNIREIVRAGGTNPSAFPATPEKLDAPSIPRRALIEYLKRGLAEGLFTG